MIVGKKRITLFKSFQDFEPYKPTLSHEPLGPRSQSETGWIIKGLDQGRRMLGTIRYITIK